MKVGMLPRCLWLLCLTALLAQPEEGVAQDDRYLFRLGLYDAEFTQSTGLQVSHLTGAAEGFAAGNSDKYSGTTGLGQAAWVAHASTGATTRIGLTDSDYTQSGGFEHGYQHSSVNRLADGFAAGASAKYSGTTNLGQAAWVAHASTGATTRVGLTDSDYTQSGGSTGHQYSEVSYLADGFAAGLSHKYSGPTNIGEAVWVANASTGTTTRVGFFDSDYTTSGGFQHGYQYSSVNLLADGFAAGTSAKYSGTTGLGYAAWVANASTGATTRVGLTDSSYTQSGGFQSGSQVSFVDVLADGFAAGTSFKYSGTTALGRAAWVANAATGTTTRVGFFDSSYTQSGGSTPGFQFSGVNALADGFAAGNSYKYSGTTSLGQAAWVANVSTGITTRIGLTDSDYTQSGGSTPGSQGSIVNRLADGFASGTSAKYSGTTYLGQAAWVVNASTGTTTRVGLFDSDYTQSGGSQPGFQYSAVSLLAHGFAAGSSFKYSGTTELGQTAWVYNLDTSTLDSIVLSLRLDGYSFSEIVSLSDTGLAVGRYTLFDGAGVDLGYRAFAWTPEDGAFDLASVVVGGISSASFTRLTEANLLTGNAFGSETILGYGVTGSNANTQAVYAATPEPGSAALLALGGLGLLARRRRAL